jgi:hypothetical protein
VPVADAVRREFVDGQHQVVDAGAETGLRPEFGDEAPDVGQDGRFDEAALGSHGSG